MTFGQCIAEVDNLVRGWANSFRFVNNRLIFSQVDKDIARKTFEFRDWTMKLEPASGPQRARILGVFQTQDVEFKPLREFVSHKPAQPQPREHRIINVRPTGVLGRSAA
jgi:hypothetical protein